MSTASETAATVAGVVVGPLAAMALYDPFVPRIGGLPVARGRTYYGQIGMEAAVAVAAFVGREHVATPEGRAFLTGVGWSNAVLAAIFLLRPTAYQRSLPW